IRLVGRNDVAARVALVLGMEHVVVDVHLLFDAPTARAERCARVADRAARLIRRCGRCSGTGAAASTTTAAPTRRARLHRTGSQRVLGFGDPLATDRPVILVA